LRSSPFKFPHVLCAAALVALAGGCASRLAPPDQMRIFTDDVLFGSPLDRHVSASRDLARWEEPLAVFMDGPGAPTFRGQVARHLADFTRLTSLDARIVDDLDDANVLIAFEGARVYLVNGEKTPCFAYLPPDKGLIRAAIIRIGVSEPKAIEHCIAHELYHAFGLRFHSVAASSVLSPVHGVQMPSAADKLALAILYDGRLRPGATREESAAIIKALAAQGPAEIGDYWTALLPLDARIEVLDGADRGFVTRYLRKRQSDIATLEVSFWNGQAVARPAVVLALLSTDRGYFIDTVPTLPEHIENINWFGAKTLDFGAQNKREGRDGVIDTIRVKMESSECLGFRQRYTTRDSRDGSTDLLLGYYCADPGETLDPMRVDDLLQSLHIRGAG
jgi:hypothetical protein